MTSPVKCMFFDSCDFTIKRLLLFGQGALKTVLTHKGSVGCGHTLLKLSHTLLFPFLGSENKGPRTGYVKSQEKQIQDLS